MFCVESAKMAVLWNGEQTDHFIRDGLAEPYPLGSFLWKLIKEDGSQWWEGVATRLPFLGIATEQQASVISDVFAEVLWCFGIPRGGTHSLPDTRPVSEKFLSGSTYEHSFYIDSIRKYWCWSEFYTDIWDFLMHRSETVFDDPTGSDKDSKVKARQRSEATRLIKSERGERLSV